MTFKNQLCIDNRCNGPGGCYHRGKGGVWCDFTVEKKLCEMLHLIWTPQLELDSLLAMIHDKLCEIAVPSTTIQLKTYHELTKEEEPKP